MLTGVNHTPTFAYVSSYAVKEKYRGQGIGQAMWAKMVQHVKMSERNVALAADLEMLPIYKDKLGFSHVSHSISKYDGIHDLTNPNLIKSIDSIRIVRVDETKLGFGHINIQKKTLKDEQFIIKCFLIFKIMVKILDKNILF